MSRDLREVLQASAARPDGALDVDDLRRRGRRVRRRRQLAAAGGFVVAVTLVVVAVVAGGSPGPDGPDVVADDSRSTAPVPDVPQRTIAEGTLGHGTMPWTMTAHTRNQGELCLTGPLSGTCGNDSDRPDGTFLVTTGMLEVEVEVEDKCVSGAVDSAATVIRVAYDDGGEQTLRPEVHDEFGLRFFAHCWTGPRNATSITALDDAGQVLDTSTGLASTFEPAERDTGTTDDVPVPDKTTSHDDIAQ